MEIRSRASGLLPSKLAFLCLVASLAFMRPDVRYPILVTDLLFVLAAAAYAADVARGRMSFRWQASDGVLAAYIIALSASIIVSPDIERSLFKASATFYLVGLAWLASRLVETEDDLRQTVFVWLAGAAVVVLIGLASLLVFPFAPDSWLVEATRFHFGTLLPGNYPRLAVTFFNANMLCNYLTACLGLLLVARQRQWLGKKIIALLMTGVVAVALFTVSPGLGGIALLLGTWLWLLKRRAKPLASGFCLAAGAGTATAFLVALAVTPIPHPTAPFLVHLPGGWVLAPSGRFLTWSAAAGEWALHPLLGHGLGIDAVSVRYQAPSGAVQNLTDAHNSILNIAAQSGLVGVIGFAILVGYVVWLMSQDSGRDRLCLGIGLSFLIAFVYEGIGGAFEDARHLWVLLGLLFAADRLRARNTAKANEPVARPAPCG